MGNNRYHRQIRHKNSQFSLVIIRSKRKTLALHVLPEAVEVRAPLKCSWLAIDNFIESRLDWLVSAQDQVKNQPRPPKFLDGEVHEYRGALVALKVVTGPSNHIEVHDGEILLQSKQPYSEKYNQDIFFKLLKSESQRLFPVRLEQSVVDFPLTVSPRGLRIRRMRSRWGSCSESGEICLNSLLVQKDIKALDLVIAHELCHLVHFYHNEAFYELMDLAMPDWRVVEGLLKTPEVGADENGQGVRAGSQFALF